MIVRSGGPQGGSQKSPRGLGLLVRPSPPRQPAVRSHPAVVIVDTAGRLRDMSEVLRHVPFPFPDDTFPPSLGAVVQRTVISGELPALIVIHDDENDWLIGDDVTDASDPDASAICHVAHVVDLDPSVAETASLPCGYAARRTSKEEPWVIEEWYYEEEE